MRSPMLPTLTLRACLLGLLSFSYLEAASPGQVVVPGVGSSKLDPSLKGRVLVEEMNCVACQHFELPT